MVRIPSSVHTDRQRPLHTLPAHRPVTPMTRKSNLRMRALSYCFRSSSVRVGRRDATFVVDAVSDDDDELDLCALNAGHRIAACVAPRCRETR